jgi:hypothetical protein
LTGGAIFIGFLHSVQLVTIAESALQESITDLSAGNKAIRCFGQTAVQSPQPMQEVVTTAVLFFIIIAC